MMPPAGPEVGTFVFWSVAGFFLLGVVVQLIRAVFAPSPARLTTPQALYAAQRQALREAGAGGEVAPEQLPVLEQELARATLDDAARATTGMGTASRNERLGLALLIAVLVPGIAVPVYLRYGSPSPPAGGPAASQLRPAEMVTELERRIALAPADPTPLMWLARVHMATGDYAAAVAAFEKLDRLAPNQPSVLLQWADARAMQAEGRLDAASVSLVERALAVEPENVTGLWLASVAAEQAGQPAAALTSLQKARDASLRSGLPVAEIEAEISALAARHGLSPAPASTGEAARAAPAVPRSVRPAGAEAASRPAPGLTLDVSVDPGLARDLPPDSVVYVLAKAVAGPPMPLAVTRVTLAALPGRITLDDSMAMAPELTLSGVREVMVSARVSRSGDASAKPGDLEGSLGPVETTTTTPLKLHIDHLVP